MGVIPGDLATNAAYVRERGLNPGAAAVERRRDRCSITTTGVHFEDRVSEGAEPVLKPLDCALTPVAALSSRELGEGEVVRVEKLIWVD